MYLTLFNPCHTNNNNNNNNKTKVKSNLIGWILKSLFFLSIGVIRCSLAKSYNNMQHCATSPKSFCGGWVGGGCLNGDQQKIILLYYPEKFLETIACLSSNHSPLNIVIVLLVLCRINHSQPPSHNYKAKYCQSWKLK